MEKVEAQPLTVMDTLRTCTQDLHTDAEGQDFQRSMGTGNVQREPFIKYLGQLYYMHKHISDLLEQHRDMPVIQKVLKPYHQDLTCVTNDLAYFDRGVSDEPILPSTKRINDYLSELAATSPVSLLGALYVLEGSTNGAKFLAKSMRKALDCPVERGASYFDRYGEAQRQRWTKFKEDMVACNFSEAQTQELVAAARRMFQAFFEIGQDLS